jgi:hypothetical protein
MSQRYSTLGVTMKIGLSANGIRKIANRLGIGERNAQGNREFTEEDIEKIIAHRDRNKQRTDEPVARRA